MAGPEPTGNEYNQIGEAYATAYNEVSNDTVYLCDHNFCLVSSINYVPVQGEGPLALQYDFIGKMRGMWRRFYNLKFRFGRHEFFEETFTEVVTVEFVFWIVHSF